MNKYTKIVLTIATLLVLTSWAVYANGADKDVKDWWTEMRDHHQTTHGDDFDEHHQEMHGDDWQENVPQCHESSDGKTRNYGSMMGIRTV